MEIERKINKSRSYFFFYGKSLIFVLFLFILSFSTIAQIEIKGGQLEKLESYKIGTIKNVLQQPLQTSAFYPYSNFKNFTGSAIRNGGTLSKPSTAFPGDTIITKFMADRLHLIGSPPFKIYSVIFSVANFNTTRVFNIIPVVRIYKTDGIGGGPGTILTSLHYSSVNVDASSTAVFNGAAGFTLPVSDIWAGISFTNLNGNYGTVNITFEQLDNLGQGIYDPIDVGSSADNYFLSSDTIGPFRGLINNPSGSISNFGGAPIANFGWGFYDLDDVLPITIESFKGFKNGIDQKLIWKINCTKSTRTSIILEQSANGKTFNGIYNILATAFQCLQPFEFTVTDPTKGLNYYRLKVIDADGNITYSSIITLLNKQRGIEFLGIFPNPLQEGKAILNIASAENIRVQLVVYDHVGRQIMTQQKTLIAGSNQVEVNFEKLPLGRYQVAFFANNNKSKIVAFIR